jgi:hypothetical protein
VVFHRLLHELRTSRVQGQQVLVVAGADHIGRESLEALTRQARRVGVRLVLLLEHLRGETKQVLGSSDSAAILMQLGNAQEAAAAAEFIGRGHKFVLSQLTHQIGKTFTTGTGYSRGVTEGTSETTSHSQTSGTNTSTGGGAARSLGRNWSQTSSDSLTTSRARTWQESVNRSVADSTNDGTTLGRVYEYTVEPTTIQSMPPTAFVLIESGTSGRRVIMGDCNPGIALRQRVSSQPLPLS